MRDLTRAAECLLHLQALLQSPRLGQRLLRYSNQPPGSWCGSARGGKAEGRQGRDLGGDRDEDQGEIGHRQETGGRHGGDRRETDLVRAAERLLPLKALLQS